MSTHADIGSILLRAAREAPRLGADEERDLVAAYRDGDAASLGKLIISNVRLAVSRAYALRGYQLSEEDLVQEGVVGLLEAASRFDVARELRFSTYAMFWIKATTTDFVLRNWSIVRTAISEEQKTLFFKLRGMKSKLQRDPSVEPGQVHAAIAAAIGVPVQDVYVMDARLSGGDVHLNAPTPWDEDGEAEIGDNFSADDGLLEDLAVGAIDEDDRERALRVAMADLDDRERIIVQERWLTEEVAPLVALAEYFEVSAAAVKKIEIAAIAKLQAGVARQSRHSRL